MEQFVIIGVCLGIITAKPGIECGVLCIDGGTLQRGKHLGILSYHITSASTICCARQTARNGMNNKTAPPDTKKASGGALCLDFWAYCTFCCNCSRSAIMAMNSLLVGLPLAEFTV